MCYKVMALSCIQYFIGYPVGKTNSTQHVIREIVHVLSYPTPIQMVGRVAAAQGLKRDILSRRTTTGFLMDMITQSAAARFGLRPNTVTENVPCMVTQLAAIVEYTITMRG